MSRNTENSGSSGHTLRSHVVNRPRKVVVDNARLAAPHQSWR